jgi:hypothetical protein
MHMLVTTPLERRIVLQHVGLGCSLLRRRRFLSGNFHHCIVGETWWRVVQSRLVCRPPRTLSDYICSYRLIVIEHPNGSGDVAYVQRGCRGRQGPYVLASGAVSWEIRVLQVYYSINLSSCRFVVSHVICVLVLETVWGFESHSCKADPAALLLPCLFWACQRHDAEENTAKGHRII